MVLVDARGDSSIPVLVVVQVPVEYIAFSGGKWSIT